MRLITFDDGKGAEVGVIVGDAIVALGRHLPHVAPSMQALISAWPEAEADVLRAMKGRPDLKLADVRLLAPLLRPGKILAIGLNYKDHIAESGLPTPEHQLWFSKQVTSVNGPFDPIELPRVADSTVDFEAELVAVIGKCGRHISRESAAEHIFGYCCGNDISVREWQRHTPQWMLGKSFDTHAPFGPWIMTPDEVGDPHALDIQCVVNGEIRQQSNTRHLLFDVFAQVEHLSKAMTLEPGDIIFTGTPGGVGAACKPPRFLKSGDVVRVEIDRIGSIEGKIISEQ